jgi:hypothetical protein
MAVVRLNGVDELILSEGDGAFVTDFDKDSEQGPLGRSKKGSHPGYLDWDRPVRDLVLLPIMLSKPEHVNIRHV